MKIEVTFVNFPVSEEIRAMVAHRIEERVAKYSSKFASARAFFTVDGYRHQVRLHVTGSEVDTTVTASSSDLGRSIDHAVERLDVTLRRAAARRKHKRWDAELIGSDWRRLTIRRWSHQSVVNVFDKYEDEFVQEFEDRFENAS